MSHSETAAFNKDCCWARTSKASLRCLRFSKLISCSILGSVPQQLQLGSRPLLAVCLLQLAIQPEHPGTPGFAASRLCGKALGTQDVFGCRQLSLSGQSLCTAWCLCLSRDGASPASAELSVCRTPEEARRNSASACPRLTTSQPSLATFGVYVGTAWPARVPFATCTAVGCTVWTSQTDLHNTRAASGCLQVRMDLVAVLKRVSYVPEALPMHA